MDLAFKGGPQPLTKKCCLCCVALWWTSQANLDYPEIPTYQGAKTNGHIGAYSGITDVQGMDAYVNFLVLVTAVTSCACLFLSCPPSTHAHTHSIRTVRIVTRMRAHTYSLVMGVEQAFPSV